MSATIFCLIAIMILIGWNTICVDMALTDIRSELRQIREQKENHNVKK